MSHDVQEREPVWQPAEPNPVKASKAWALAPQLLRGRPATLAPLDSLELSVLSVKCTGTESVKGSPVPRPCVLGVTAGFWVGVTKHYSSEAPSFSP